MPPTPTIDAMLHEFGLWSTWWLDQPWHHAYFVLALMGFIIFISKRRTSDENIRRVVREESLKK